MRSPFAFLVRSCLLHHNLFNEHLCARGDVEEVDALGHAFHTDLFSVFGIAVGNHLTHAVVHCIAVLGIASVDV